jgi:hypothetical protein
MGVSRPPAPKARMAALGPVLESYLEAVAPAVRRLTDRQLLDRFRRARDGDAFAELVREPSDMPAARSKERTVSRVNRGGLYGVRDGIRRRSACAEPGLEGCC